MPGGSKYQGPSAALVLYAAAVSQSMSGVDVKGAKNPYTSRNGHMFSFLDATGSMALRLSEELAEDFMARYNSAPVIQYGSVMRGYVAIPQDLLNDTATLAAWFDKSHVWIGTLKPKPTKR